MLSNYHFSVALIALGVFSGCQRESVLPGASQAASAGQAAASESEAEVTVLNPNVDFSVTPDTLRECADVAPVTAEVKWEIRDPAISEVKIEVGDTNGSPRKLLSQAGRQGSVSTEAWVVVGTKFFLIEFSSGKELASVAVKGIECK